MLKSIIVNMQWVQPTSNSSPSCAFCGHQQHWGCANDCAAARISSDRGIPDALTRDQQWRHKWHDRLGRRELSEGRFYELLEVERAESKSQLSAAEAATDAALRACEVWRLASIHHAEAEAVAIRERDGLREKYNELLYEVVNKWPNETRHETAKRYIHERENQPSSACAKMTKPASTD